jgi:hypothetical protein
MSSILHSDEKFDYHLDRNIEVIGFGSVMTAEAILKLDDGEIQVRKRRQ